MGRRYAHEHSPLGGSLRSTLAERMGRDDLTALARTIDGGNFRGPDHAADDVLKAASKAQRS